MDINEIDRLLIGLLNFNHIKCLYKQKKKILSTYWIIFNPKLLFTVQYQSIVDNIFYSFPVLWVIKVTNYSNLHYTIKQNFLSLPEIECYHNLQ